MSEQTVYRGNGRPRRTDVRLAPQPTVYRGRGRPRMTDIIIARDSKRMYRHFVTRDIYELRPIEERPPTVVAPSRSAASVPKRYELRKPPPTRKVREVTKNLQRHAEDTSPQWLRKLRKEFTDKFILTGVLDKDILQRFQSYAHAHAKASAADHAAHETIGGGQGRRRKRRSHSHPPGAGAYEAEFRGADEGRS